MERSSDNKCSRIVRRPLTYRIVHNQSHLVTPLPCSSVMHRHHGIPRCHLRYVFCCCSNNRHLVGFNSMTECLAFKLYRAALTLPCRQDIRAVRLLPNVHGTSSNTSCTTKHSKLSRSHDTQIEFQRENRQYRVVTGTCAFEALLYGVKEIDSKMRID